MKYEMLGQLRVANGSSFSYIRARKIEVLFALCCCVTTRS
jgi:hypothetical protein